MSRYFVLITIYSMLSMACNKTKTASTELPFEKTYGGNLVDYASEAIYSDGYIYMVGTSKSLQSSSGGLALTKIDALGNLVFEKSYGGTILDFGTNIVKTSDGNLLLLGITSLPTNSGTQVDILIVKVDVDGNTIWSRTYGDATQFDVAEGLIETSNGDILVLGSAHNGSTNDFSLTCLNSQGDLKWEKIYTSPYNDEGINIAKTEQDEYLLLGRRKDGDDDFYLLKVDEQGNVLWEQSYGTPQYEQAHSIRKTLDGHFLLCGHSSGIDPLHNLYVAKISTDGIVVFEEHYGGVAHDGGTSAIELSNGNLLLAGETDSYGNGSKRAFLLETSADGTLIQEQSFGGDLSDKFSTVIETEKAYYLIGESASFSESGDIDMYVVKRLK
ncbi:hypothetical protein [Aureispira sp. CCB-E]|uniref:hypothetical protein n=1 Tax=Aureispira sp. CCB-E TaxID=3051121 RepID=UPI002868B30E|nr:hypothetical protein [Aureispira sp. CCB-E]WMX12561.1 hypothetical protein QP953_17160 [Aureispira sp. CCB-E]